MVFQRLEWVLCEKYVELLLVAIALFSLLLVLDTILHVLEALDHCDIMSLRLKDRVLNA